MEVFGDYRELKRFPKTVVTLGNFDGVHVGHQALIQRTIKLAKAVEGTPVLFTLDPHPLKVLQPDYCPPLLLKKTDKIEILSAQGIAAVAIAEFSREMAALDAEEFVKRIIIDGMGPCAVVIGYNYSFGKGGRGNPEILSELGRGYGFQVEIVPQVTVDGMEVSSTNIRKLINKGVVDKAGELLGYHPFLKGTVVTGEQLGRTLGFPTANLAIPEGIIVPANGVYLARIGVADRYYDGVVNIGTRPTVRGDNPKNVEVHIFEFAEDIYGAEIKVEFVKGLRPEKKFASLQELTRQIQMDVDVARRFLGTLELKRS